MKKKTVFVFVAIAAVVALAMVIMAQYVAINNPLIKGNALAVVFDKAAVLNADKIILKKDGKEMVITDEVLVKDLAKEFIVADSTGLCGYYQDRWMEIYSGDQLVRNIHWNDHDDLVEVYEADQKHWLLPSYSTGQINLSEQTTQKMNQLFEQIK